MYVTTYFTKHTLVRRAPGEHHAIHQRISTPLQCVLLEQQVLGPVAGRAQAETPHLPSTECLSKASRATASLSAARRASTTVSTPLLSAPAVPQCAQADAGACGGPCAG